MKRKYGNKIWLHAAAVFAALFSGLITCSAAGQQRGSAAFELYSFSDRDLQNPLSASGPVSVASLEGYTEYYILKTEVSDTIIPLRIEAENMAVEIFRIGMVSFGRDSAPDALVPIEMKDFVLGSEPAYYLLSFSPGLKSSVLEARISAGIDRPGSSVTLRFSTGGTSYSDIAGNIPRNAFSVYVPSFLKDSPAEEKAAAYRNIAEGLIEKLGFSPKYPPEIFWESEDYRNWYLGMVNSVSVKKQDVAGAIGLGLGSGYPYYYRLVDEPKGGEDLVKIRDAKAFYESENYPAGQLVAFNHSYVALRDIFKAVRNDVDIWCLNLNLLNSKRVRDNLDRLRREGREIWIYVCCDDGRDMNVHLTAQLLESRAIFWYMWLNDIDGFLYWSVNRWMNRDAVHDPRVSTKRKRYGDGILIYPDPEDDFSFLMSLRAINIKAGMMEYAVLSSLDEAGRKKLSAEVSGIIGSPRKFSSNPADYDKLIQTAKSLLP